MKASCMTTTELRNNDQLKDNEGNSTVTDGIDAQSIHDPRQCSRRDNNVVVSGRV